MTHDAGLTSQDTEYPRPLQEALNERQPCAHRAQSVTSPPELEAWERAMRPRTDPVGSFLVGYHLQQALDAVALPAEQEQLVSYGPHPLTNDGKVRGRIRTAQGLAVPVRD